MLCINDVGIYPKRLKKVRIPKLVSELILTLRCYFVKKRIGSLREEYLIIMKGIMEALEEIEELYFSLMSWLNKN